MRQQLNINKINLFFILFLGFFLIHFNITNAETYKMFIANEKLQNNIYEFDVFIRSAGTDFVLTSYQSSINFDNQVANGGSLTFNYLPGTSEISKFPKYSIGVNKLDGKMELAFASCGITEEIIGDSNKRIGRFSLQNTAVFTNSPFNLSWCFDGNSSTMITGSDFTNITDQSSHFIYTPVAQENIVLSAETGILGNGAALKTKAGSVGSKVVYCPTNKGYVKFNVDLPKDGNWYVWGRFFYEGSGKDPNAFNFKILFNNKYNIYAFGNNKDFFNKWHWDGDGSVQKGSVAKLSIGSLPAGTYTIVVSGREPGSTVMIDQIVLTQDPDFVPTDANYNLKKEAGLEPETIAEIPSDYQLMQNYPNPFNPSTTIRFALNQSSLVSLKIYDILGKEIQTLVNDVKEAGIHEVVFDASNLSSGIYLYILNAGNFTATKKLMLMK